MEKRFQIVTDSSCDLPQALADELDLAVLPLHVLIGEHTYANYLDGREIGFKEFYDKLRNGERATTSAVNVSEFTAVMEGKLKEGLDILFIGFSSGLLGVLVTCLLCLPINAIIQALTGISTIRAFLPLPAAVVLILISIALTLIAGIIPSRSAAKKDPVVALRTE